MNEVAKKFHKWLYSEHPKNSDVLQIIELGIEFLDLKTLTQYAQDNNMSYNGAKSQKDKITLFGKVFLSDND